MSEFSLSNFKTMREMIAYIKLNKSEAEQTLKELNDIGFILFNPHKTELKQRKSELKEKLEELRSNIDMAIGSLHAMATFKTEEFLPFLRKYLLLKEGTEYVSFVMKNDNINAGSFLDGSLGNIDNYIVITTLENKKAIEQNNNSEDIYIKLRKECPDNKYICLKYFSSYDLFEYGGIPGTLSEISKDILSSSEKETEVSSAFGSTELSKEYNNFPDLYWLADELVGIYLSNPNLSDKERLNIVLKKLESQKGISLNEHKFSEIGELIDLQKDIVDPLYIYNNIDVINKDNKYVFGESSQGDIEPNPTQIITDNPENLFQELYNWINEKYGIDVKPMPSNSTIDKNCYILNIGDRARLRFVGKTEQELNWINDRLSMDDGQKKM